MYDIDMNVQQTILKKLEECGFRVSTDTRKDVIGSIYFALKGENFDGSMFAHDALKRGAIGAVTDNSEIAGGNIYLVDDVLKTLQSFAHTYRKRFTIPIVVIGGSNGKTTSRGLVYDVLKTKYKVHSSQESLNNHFGVPLSILAMDPKTEIGVFEIGANHPGEHLALLEILDPTMVIVTNNGLDHLGGFGSPMGSRMANKELYDWARNYQLPALVNKDLSDLIEDSLGLERTLYPIHELKVFNSTPLTFIFESEEYTTNLVGDYNIENIQLALAVGKYFEVDLKQSLEVICKFQPSSKRSQFLKVGKMNIILDCYNANPSSMKLSLESFFRSVSSPRGVVLGDMLELGSYSETEHKKVVEYVSKQKLDCAVFIGNNFKKALSSVGFMHQWFLDSNEARTWFQAQNFDGFTMILKGSKGTKVANILNS